MRDFFQPLNKKYVSSTKLEDLFQPLKWEGISGFKWESCVLSNFITFCLCFFLFFSWLRLDLISKRVCRQLRLVSSIIAFYFMLTITLHSILYHSFTSIFLQFSIFRHSFYFEYLHIYIPVHNVNPYCMNNVRVRNVVKYVSLLDTTLCSPTKNDSCRYIFCTANLSYSIIENKK